MLDVSKRVLLRIPAFSSISDSGASGGAGALSLLAAPRGEIAPAGHASLSLSLPPSPLSAFTVAQSRVTTHKAPPPHPTPPPTAGPLYQVLNAAAEVVNEIIAGGGEGGSVWEG